MSCLPAQFTNQRVGHTNFWRVGRHPIKLGKGPPGRRSRGLNLGGWHWCLICESPIHAMFSNPTASLSKCMQHDPQYFDLTRPTLRRKLLHWSLRHLELFQYLFTPTIMYPSVHVYFHAKKKCQVSMTITKYEEYSNVDSYHDNQPTLQNWMLWGKSSLRVKWTQAKTHDGRVVINPSLSSLSSSSKT